MNQEKITLLGFDFSFGHGSVSFHAAKALNENDSLCKLICPSFKSASDVAIDPFPVKKFDFKFKIISAGISSLSYFSKRIPARHYQEVLFDTFATRHVDSPDAIFCIPNGMIKSIIKANKKGISTIVQGQMAHPLINLKILMEEASKFNVHYSGVHLNSKWIRNRCYSLEECDKIIAVSSSIVKETYINMGIPENKIEVIPLGVDNGYFFPPKERPSEFRVLFVGSGSLIKGLPYLLEAWDFLDLNDSELIVCGKQNQEIISRYRGLTKLQVLGFVDPREYYRKSTIFVNPALTDGNPKAVLEALSCGLPVIITEWTGSKDFIEDGKEGFIVPIRNSKSLKDRIQYFYDNPREIKRMGREARKTAEKYTWHRYEKEIARKIKESIEDLK